MNLYDKALKKELDAWHKSMTKPPSKINNLTKGIQQKTQSLIPEKVQNMLTASIKTMTETIMFGSNLLTSVEISANPSLSEGDWLVEKAFQAYNKAAVAQGAGFGAGGILLGMADFPALLTIKVKFLFDCARFYGYDVNDKNERLYMLYIFQLAFSSDAHRIKTYHTLMDWERKPIDADTMNWEKFQTEYRDYIDIAKMLQLLPVVGAVVGAVANFRLLEKLKTTAMNCYRSRRLYNSNICPRND